MALIKLVQAGTATFASGSTRTDINIISVDTSKTFVITQVDGVNSNESGRVGVLSQFLSSDSLTLLRGRTGSTITALHYYVAEFSSGILVQHGSALLSTSTTNVGLFTSVNTAQSFIFGNSRTYLTSWNATVLSHPVFVGPDSINIICSAAAATANEIGYQVVDYTGCSVQFGQSRFGTAVDKIVVSLTAIDTSKTALIYNNYSSEGVSWNSSRVGVMGYFENETTLNLIRETSGTSIVNVAWFVVEHTDGTIVQAGTTRVLGATSDMTIASIDTTASCAWMGGPWNGGGNKEVSDVAANGGPFMGRTAITSPTAFTIDRMVTTGTANFGWFVVQYNSAAAAANNIISTKLNVISQTKFSVQTGTKLTLVGF